MTKLAKLCLGIILLALPTAISAQTTCDSQNCAVWNRWETSLTSLTTYANAYYEVKFKVTYTKVGDPAATYTGYGFWDGGNTFKIRTAFPSTGTWQWRTTCEAGCLSDAGLHDKSGNVTVGPYTGSNGLYKRGFLKVVATAAGPRLVHESGFTFYWLGDTAWAGPTNATSTEWTSYLSDRGMLFPTDPSKSRFTLIQTALPVDWMKTRGVQPTNETTRRPFVPGNACFDTAGNAIGVPCAAQGWKIQPLYWSNFDQKIQEANSQGFVVMLVGLMERLIEGPTNDPQPYPSIEDSKLYARNIVARLAGNFVIFSPGFDSRALSNEPALLQRMKTIGAEIKSTSPRHLVTNHYARNSDEALLHSESWLSFHLFQSGQFRAAPTLCEQLEEITRNPRTKPLAIRALPSAKASVNGEAIYDCGRNPNPVLGATYYNPYRVRQAGYLSMLSGAIGYTYGVFGVMDWGASPDTETNGCNSYLQGMQRSSNQDIRRLGGFFRNFPWETLIPRHDLITNQVGDGSCPTGTNQDKKMVLAIGTNTNGVPLLAAYLPNNSEIRINLAQFPTLPKTGVWVSTRSGFTTTATAQVNGSVYTYQRPACPGSEANCTSEPDWLLLLR